MPFYALILPTLSPNTPSHPLPKHYLTTVNWPPPSRNLSHLSPRRPAFQSLIPHVCRLDHFQTYCFFFSIRPLNYLQALSTNCSIGKALTPRSTIRHPKTQRLDLPRETSPDSRRSLLVTICAPELKPTRRHETFVEDDDGPTTTITFSRRSTVTGGVTIPLCQSGCAP